MQFDPLTSGLISMLNWLAGVPQGVVVILHVVIEYED